MNSALTDHLKENYLNFRGRASASEYRHFNVQIALHVGLAIVLFGSTESISFGLRQTDVNLPITLWLAFAVVRIAYLVLFLPLLALSVRQLHDMNHSGWWLVPVLGFAAVLGPQASIISLGFFLYFPLRQLLLIRLLGGKTPEASHLIPQVTGITLSPTLRESEVLSLVGKGLRVVDVAIALELVSSTVSSHIKAIYRKLNISIRAEAAFQTARLGLLRG